MTREEEIWNAINNLQIGDYNEDDPSDNDEYDGSDLQNAFCAGAKWADANPKSPWISVDGDLPYNNPNNIHFGFISFTNRVLTTDGKINIFIAYMKNINNKWVWYSDDNFDVSHIITHWMPFPKLPKN